MDRLYRYFTEGIIHPPLPTIGIEVETSFVDERMRPISLEQGQILFSSLVEKRGWKIRARKGTLVTEIEDGHGNRVLYELGRQNIELSSPPLTADQVIPHAKSVLDELYEIAETVKAFPCFTPVLPTKDDLLIIPDERDAIWLELDGRPALELLARISAVQFTISVTPQNAISILNRLGEQIGFFLKGYAQEEHWRRYIHESNAAYHPFRYGGPLFFDDLADYCRCLTQHAVVSGPRLIAYDAATNFDISFYLRSIWWYFRLKRYGNTLCVEIRPLPRLGDDKLEEQLKFVLDILR